MGIPIIGFAGYSGSGKTTLIENLIPLLRAKGLRLAVIKHDGHRFEIDREGKDSWRFSHAGAEMVVLTSKEKAAVIEQRELSLEDSLDFVHDVDLILIEGWKSEDIPKIGVSRKAIGKGFSAPLDEFIALVTDEDMPACMLPIFSFSETIQLADFIYQNMHYGKHLNTL